MSQLLEFTKYNPLDPNPSDMIVAIDPETVVSVEESKDALANRFTNIELSTGTTHSVKEETSVVLEQINEARQEKISAEESNNAKAD